MHTFRSWHKVIELCRCNIWWKRQYRSFAAVTAAVWIHSFIFMFVDYSHKEYSNAGGKYVSAVVTKALDMKLCREFTWWRFYAHRIMFDIVISICVLLLHRFDANDWICKFIVIILNVYQINRGGFGIPVRKSSSKSSSFRVRRETINDWENQRKIENISTNQYNENSLIASRSCLMANRSK